MWPIPSYLLLQIKMLKITQQLANANWSLVTKEQWEIQPLKAKLHIWFTFCKCNEVMNINLPTKDRKQCLDTCVSMINWEFIVPTQPGVGHRYTATVCFRDGNRWEVNIIIKSIIKWKLYCNNISSRDETSFTGLLWYWYWYNDTEKILH